MAYDKDAHRERVKRYRATERGAETTKAAKIRYRRKLRTEVLAAYGGRCECCGESEPIFLTIDHINNDGGGRNRTRGGLALMLDLKREGYPREDHRLLCFNCNTGRHINGGICPHEQTN